MAIYHLSGQVISRSQGRSSVAAASYRSAEKLIDERLEKTYDFTKKEHDVFHKEILLPKDAPERLKDRETLWNEVEKCENRKDAQLAREFNIALPKELTKEQNIKLAREFVQKEFVDKGMIADLCLHLGHKGNEEQPHMHVMLTLRSVDEQGFGKKVREWNDKGLLEHWREEWANTVNKELALNGLDFRIDHRSNAERGIDLEPQYKIGAKAAEQKMARYEDHQRIARENGEKIFAEPEIALDAITKQQSTFTHHDLARFVNRHTVDAEQFQRVYDKIKGHEQIVRLGKDEQGRERFTTQEMLDVEQKMLTDVNSLRESNGHAIKQATIPDYLSVEQREALEHMTKSGDIKCVIGYAGTGKSTILNAARETWEKEGYRVHGATLSGIAAENLAGASGIESRTIASRLYYWDKGQQRLTERDVLVVDEAGMLGSRQMSRIVEEVRESGAKLVLIGDPQQLQAIEAGAAFRAITEQVSYVELTHIRRQREEWQCEATKEFAQGEVDRALDRYDRHDHLHEFDTQLQAKQSLVEMWNDARISEAEKTQIILAYTRKDAQDLNEMAREMRRANDELGVDHIIQTERGERQFAAQDRIYFLKNERSLGVMNGSLGTIEKIDNNVITVRLDKDLENANNRTVTVDTNFYNHLDHGYAATIHKAQGVTVDRSYVVASKYMDSHSSYVAMSRHRESADMFWGKDEFTNQKELCKALARDRSKDVTLDYGIVSETEPAKQQSQYIEATKSQQLEIQPRESKPPLEINRDTKEVIRETNKEAEQTLTLSRSAEFVINSYIEKQAKLNELMQHKNENLSRNPAVAKLYAQEAVAVDKSINDFARQIMKNPELKKEFSQYNHEQKSQERDRVRQTVGDRGGWEVLQERQKQNQLSTQDGQLVARHLQNRVESQVLERQLSRDRGLEHGRER